MLCVRPDTMGICTSVNVLWYLGHTIELNSILVLFQYFNPRSMVSVKWLLVCHMLPLWMFSTFSLKYKHYHMTCWQSIAMEEFPWQKKITFTSCILKLFRVSQLNWDWRKDYMPLCKFKCVQSITRGRLISCYITCSPEWLAITALCK